MPKEERLTDRQAGQTLLFTFTFYVRFLCSIILHSII